MKKIKRNALLINFHVSSVELIKPTVQHYINSGFIGNGIKCKKVKSNAPFHESYNKC